MCFYDSVNTSKSFVYFSSDEGFNIKSSALIDSLPFKPEIGIVTDFSIANQANPFGYVAKHTGKWSYAYAHEPNPPFEIGIMGYSIFTKEPLSTLNFTYQNSIKQSNAELIIYTNKSNENFDLIIFINNIEFKTIPGKEVKSIIKIPLNQLEVNSVEIKTKKTSNNQTHFVFHGMFIKGKNTKTITIHTIPLKQNLLYFLQNTHLWENQLKEINPNLTFLDFGTFPFLWGLNSNTSQVQLKYVLNAISAQISKQNGIVCISSQELMRQKYPMLDAYNFNFLLHESYLYSNFALLDWYTIAGGYKSSAVWQTKNLLNKNGFSLNKNGLLQKEKVLALSMLNFYTNLQKGILSNQKPDFLQIEKVDTIDKKEKVDIKFEKGLETETETERKLEIEKIKALEKVQLKLKDKYTVHKVKKGETLFAIAKKYKVTEAELSEINKLKNGVVKVNQILNIPLTKTQKEIFESNKQSGMKKHSKGVEDGKKGTDGGIGRNSIRKPIENVVKPKLEDTITKKVTKEVEVKPKKTKEDKKYKFHIVKKGETLFALAKKYAVTVEEIKKCNNLKNNNLFLGTKIKIEI